MARRIQGQSTMKQSLLSKKRLSTGARRLSRGPPARHQTVIDPPALLSSPQQSNALSPVESNNENDPSSISPIQVKRKLRRLSGPARRIITPNSKKKNKPGNQSKTEFRRASTDASISKRCSLTLSSKSLSSTSTTHNQKKNTSINATFISNASSTSSSSSSLTSTTNKSNTPRNWRRSDFKIGSALGRGKYGYVYSAVESGSRREVALKVQPKLQITNSAAALLQLRREVQIHSRLHHRNIVELLGYMHDLKHCYMVLERCDSGHLYTELLRQGKFNDSMSKHWCKQLISALQYCHDRHVIHRDIKLENMLVHGNVLKLADFGWAVHVPGKNDGQRTTLCGSPAYVSPEIVDRRPHGHWTDLWSVGVAVYEMLHGRPPFEAASEKGIFERIRSVDLMFPEAAVVIENDEEGDSSGDQFVHRPADANNMAREVIQGLLRYEPRERWSLKKCLKSMWLTESP